MLKYARWPVVTERHREATSNVVDSGDWHYGTVYKHLEGRLSSWLGRPAVTTSSCAWSLFLALRALDLSGKIVVPAYGYHGTVHPILWAGATPLFVDSDPTTFNLCPHSLESTLACTSVDAVIGVHTHGMPFDFAIVEICDHYGIPLIEDVCQAQGAYLRGHLTGTLGTFGAFSFNSRKTLPAGLGGALAVRDEKLITRLEDLRNYGSMDADGVPTEIGYYLPIGEFDAALALVQLDDLPLRIERTDSLAAIIRQAIPTRFPAKPPDRTHTWHKIRIKGTEDDRLRLEASGIITSRWVPKPLTEYSCFRSFLASETFPGADEICKDTFCIFNDGFPLMAQSEELVREVAKTLADELI